MQELTTREFGNRHLAGWHACVFVSMFFANNWGLEDMLTKT